MRLAARRPRAALVPSLQALHVRHHSHSNGHGHSHGGGAVHSHADRAGGELRSRMAPHATSLSASGPRMPLSLGFETARALTNVSRALEAHAEASVSAYVDMFDSVWSKTGLLFVPSADAGGDGWTATTAEEELASLRTRRALPVCKPSLLSIAFGDERSALVRLLGADNRERFLSMLRTDGLESLRHDGWQIMREVVGNEPNALPTRPSVASADTALSDVRGLLAAYIGIEHGGGAADCELAASLFSERAALLSVGTAAIGPDDEGGRSDPWSAPAGALLEIPLATYLDGVASQRPHADGARAHDQIVSIDILPCHTAASATVHVGNGSMDTVFVDHLLLAKAQPTADGVLHGGWRVLSKTFAPRPWPA